MTVRAPAKRIHLELITYEDVSAALAAGSSTVLVPCGAVEQHGPHLPLAMDADHAEALAARVAELLGNTLIAPTITVGCSAHHLGFPGTISLRPETFESVCVDYCTSLAKHGFKRILFFSGHIGNFPVLQACLSRLRDCVPSDVEILAFADSIAWIDEWKLAVKNAGGNPNSVGGHADLAETSLMLRLRPDCVKADRFEAGHVGSLSEEQLHSMWRNGIKSIAPNGIIGDPRGSNVEIGDRCLEAVAVLLVNAFQK
jgi:creatinine amidohydrolase